MEILALVVFLCFLTAVNELREWKMKNTLQQQEDEFLLRRIELEKRLSQTEKALAEVNESFLELKATGYRLEEQIKILVRAHEARLSGGFSPPDGGDHYEVI